MKRSNILFFLIIALCACACAKDIVDLDGDISGTVKDYSSGHFIENCKVTLSPGGKSTLTGEDGVYGFSDIEPGEYTVSFYKAGYNDESTSITVIAGQVSTASTLLKAKSAFALSETVLDFGDLESGKLFYAFNNSDQDCSFSISGIPGWLHLSKEKGTVRAESSEAISADISRESEGFGEFSQVLNVSYSGKVSGSVALIVKFSNVQKSAPKVSIADDAKNIGKDSFDITGAILATGGSQITSYGHCWSTSSAPTTNDSKTNLGATSATEQFTSQITGLSPFTTYYVRAYATNSEGTSYSNQIAVTTKDIDSELWDGQIAKSFDGGKGTISDPYLIRTGGQLLLVKNYADKYFELCGNINLDNKPWLPIEKFSGSFDGKGYTISNLKIERATNDIGLFATSSGKIKNVTIKGVKINVGNSSNVGALVGSVVGKIDDIFIAIENCNVILLEDSKIQGKEYVGGVVGMLRKSIDRCNVNSSTKGYGIVGEAYVGGLCGLSQNGDISGCHVTAKVIGDNKVGGMAGSTFCDEFDYGHHDRYYTDISLCSFSGEVSGSLSVGGMVGYHNQRTYIKGCKVSADISSENGNAGGFIGDSTTGWESASAHIYGSYVTGKINGGKKSGGFIGAGYDNEAILSYSAVTGSSSGFYGFGEMGMAQDCATTYSNATPDKWAVKNVQTESPDITSFLQGCYSDYSTYWNFNQSWQWVGTGGNKVLCPQLSWE